MKGADNYSIAQDAPSHPAGPTACAACCREGSQLVFIGKHWTRSFRFIMAAVAAIAIAGCASTGKVARQRTTNMGPEPLLINPQVTFYNKRWDVPRLAGTFAVFPYSVIDGGKGNGSAEEPQLLFELVNFVESMGFRFVRLDQHPDLLLTIDVRSFAPGYSRHLGGVFYPYWSPGRQLSRKDFPELLARPSIGGNWRNWGEWNPPLSTGEKPGYMEEADRNMKPPDGQGFYYLVNVQAYSGRTLRNEWMATGVAAARTRNTPVAVQKILQTIIDQFPFTRKFYESRSAGYTGLSCSDFTVDGTNYYPVVLSFIPDAPAEKAGMKIFDRIVRVDGVDVRNKQLGDVIGMIIGKPGTSVKLTVWRVDRLLTFTITRVRLLPHR